MQSNRNWSRYVQTLLDMSTSHGNWLPYDAISVRWWPNATALGGNEQMD
jgi:hypothetical protein